MIPLIGMHRVTLVKNGFIKNVNIGVWFKNANLDYIFQNLVKWFIDDLTYWLHIYIYIYIYDGVLMVPKKNYCCLLQLKSSLANEIGQWSTIPIPRDKILYQTFSKNGVESEAYFVLQCLL